MRGAGPDGAAAAAGADDAVAAGKLSDDSAGAAAGVPSSAARRSRLRFSRCSGISVTLYEDRGFNGLNPKSGNEQFRVCPMNLCTTRQDPPLPLPDCVPTKTND